MPVLDGVEAAKRIRMLERKRKVTAQLPSEQVAFVQGYHLIVFFSCRFERRLPGIDQEALPERGDERLLQQAFEKR